MRKRYNAYSATHRAERLAYTKAYNAAHREERAAYMRRYQQEHQEYFRTYNRTYGRGYRTKNQVSLKTKQAARRDGQRAWLAALKDAPCADCGGVFPPECLDFDHRTDKCFTIAQSYLSSKLRIMTEIAKCDLVCSNCHRTRTLTRKGGRKTTYRATQLAHEIDQLKARPCADCGKLFPPECMDFDHLPEHLKARGVGSLRSATAAQRPILLAEIAKCDLVCSNCHRVRTRRRRKT